MNILYVTPLWAGFRDIICDGATGAKGMPAFIRPLRRLIELGHDIDFVVATPTDLVTRLNVQVPWLQNSKFYMVPWDFRGVSRLISPLRFYRQIKRVLSQRNYEFVYCHGSVGALGNIAALKKGLSCGMRLYGTFLAEQVRKNARVVAYRHPLEYLCYKLPKQFLIMTNDGTKGDYVKQKLSPDSHYDFHFWFNGRKCIHSNNTTSFELRLFYPARITRWKRQHLALEILKHLILLGHHDVTLCFAGHIQDAVYWEEIQRKAKEYRLDALVKYLGVLGEDELLYHYSNSLAVLSLYEVSNLGNVVIEAMSSGAVVLSINDGSLNSIIRDGLNGILVDSPIDGANRISELITDMHKTQAMRRLATQSIEKLFLPWEQRVSREIEVIMRACDQKIYSNGTRKGIQRSSVSSWERRMIEIGDDIRGGHQG